MEKSVLAEQLQQSQAAQDNGGRWNVLCGGRPEDQQLECCARTARPLNLVGQGAGGQTTENDDECDDQQNVV
jgi:hypothetical protein